MNDWTARNIQLNFDFLTPGNYEATIYSDTSDGDQYPNNLTKITRQLNQNGILEVQLASGGGQVMHLRKL